MKFYHKAIQHKNSSQYKLKLIAVLSITVISFFCKVSTAYCQIVFDNNSPIYNSKKDTVKHQYKTLFSGNILASTGKIYYWNNDKMSMVTDVKKTMVLLMNVKLKTNYYFFGFFNFQFNKDIYKYVTWIPDYSFMICRDKYIPNTFMWGYANFGLNRYKNSLHDIEKSLSTGSFYFGYRIPLPQKFINCIKIHSSSNLILSAQMNYSIKYYNVNSNYTGGLLTGKSSLGLNIQYNIYKGLFINGATAYNFKKDTQSPWASDYSYGFGFVNGKPWKLSILYSNSLNKFPWSKNKIKSGFLYGDLGLALNYTIQYKKPY